MAGRAACIASKGAVEGLTRAMALELGPKGVRVNAVAPGLIATEALLAGMRDPDVQTAVQRHIPEGRFGRPEEVAAAILFVASSEASYLNGAIIGVDAALGARESTPALRPFTLGDGTTVDAVYMEHTDSLPLLRDPDFVAVELPYEGDELSLVDIAVGSYGAPTRTVVQPADLAAFETRMSAARLNEIAQRLRVRDIEFKVPTWSTKTDVDALGPLHGLGLPRAYDFSTMVDPAALARIGGRDLTIDEILHTARIEVDEEGTTAAAATVIGIKTTSIQEVEIVTIDSPFLYFIRDRVSGAILFVGHVADPTMTAAP